MTFDFSKEPGKKLLNRGMNINEKPLVSIVTPYYNAGKYFEQTYNCVLNQTFPWFEWIIINDGSTNEDDVKKLETLAKNDPRIKILNQENKGQSSARNLGIKNSITEIIIPLDADDLIIPTYIECVFWGLMCNEKYSWCYTDSLGFQGQEYLWKKPFSAEVMKHDNILTCTAAIRKKDLLEVGCYDEVEKHYDEDWKLWLELLSNKKAPVHLNEIGFWYRRTDSGMGATVRKDKELLGKSNEIIKNVAQNVDSAIKAKEYYCSEGNKFNIPENIEWDKKVFKEHNKINVMMIMPWMEMGGADLFNLDVVRKIRKNKYEVSILTTVKAENTWRQRFEEYATDIFDLTSFLDVQDYSKFISYFIKSRQIDIIFLTNSYYGYYLVPWLRKEFPSVAIVDYVHMEEWYWRNGGYARTSGAIGEIVERTYVCNEKTRKVMIDTFNRKPEDVKTLYIGVDKDKFDVTKVAEGESIKRDLGIEISRPTILFPCRIHPQKRPFLMVEIARKVKKTINDVAFIVVGDGPQFQELQIKVKNDNLQDTIYFAGRQNDMRPYYKESDITLICSLKEGLALTAYESLSMSTPVISSDVGGQAELIDEKVGIIVPLLQDEEDSLDMREFNNEEIMSYVDAIVNILEDKDKHEKMCKNCRKRIEEGFSTDIMIENLQNEFEWLMNDEVLKNRQQVSKDLRKYNALINDYITLYSEYELLENSFKNAYDGNTKNELMRLANSRWGSRLIRMAFKMKINKLFK